MKKKTTILLLSFAILLGSLFAEEEKNNTTAKLLREALFAEEADRDLAKAEKGYRDIVKNFDADRAYAATAILRLGEILNKRGETDEAEKWFARVLQEFPDQEAIAKVARARLGDRAAALVGTSPIKADPQIDEVERLKKLLAQSPDLLDTPKDGTTPLVTAASNGQLDVIEFLLSKGVRISGGDGYNDHYPSALAAAVEKGHIEVIKRLIKAGAKPERDLIHLAVLSGNYATTELIIKAGADPNTYSDIDLFQGKPGALSGSARNNSNSTSMLRRPEPTDSSSLGRVRWTPLEIATFYRFAKLTDLLLANNAKPQKRKGYSTEWRFTDELRFAILDQNIKLIAKLLDHGADPNSQWNGFSAIAIAAKGGNAEVVKQLIEAGADVNSVEPNSGRTPLHYARGATAEPLLKAGADPNAPDKSGNTPLHSADDSIAAKALLAAGADVNAVDQYGASPVTHADLRVLDILLEAKPDLAISGRHGTALGHAASNSRKEPTTERIEKLIAAGADPNQVDKNGKTPLLIAVENLQAETAAALIAGGANPNGAPNNPAPLTALPNNRSTAISNSTKPNYAPTIRTLVEAGADPNAVDSSGLTALMKVAGDSADIETVRYLLKKGASPEVGGEFASDYVDRHSPLKAELFLAAYLQPERRRGIIRVVATERGERWAEVSAFVSTDEKLPPCPYSLIEAYAFCDGGATIALGEVKIWREGEVEPLKFDLRNIIASGDPAQDVALAWGDLVEFDAANSPEEAAVSTTEKDFLDAHLERAVSFTQDGETHKVALNLDWHQLPNGNRWTMARRADGKTHYKENTQNLSLVALNQIGLKGSSINRYTPKKWIVKRGDGQTLEVTKHWPTLWLEDGDQISFEGGSATEGAQAKAEAGAKAIEAIQAANTAAAAARAQKQRGSRARVVLPPPSK